MVCLCVCVSVCLCVWQIAGRFLSVHVLRPLLEFIGAWDDRLRADLATRLADCRRLREKCVQ